MAFQAYGNTSIRIVFATALLLAIGPLRGRPTISTLVDLPAHDWSTKGLLDPGYCGPVLYLLGLLGCIVTRNNVKSFTFTVCKKLLSLQHVHPYIYRSEGLIGPFQSVKIEAIQEIVHLYRALLPCNYILIDHLLGFSNINFLPSSLP
jgi:hypothetical protein